VRLWEVARFNKLQSIVFCFIATLWKPVCVSVCVCVLLLLISLDCHAIYVLYYLHCWFLVWTLMWLAWFHRTTSVDFFITHPPTPAYRMFVVDMLSFLPMIWLIILYQFQCLDSVLLDWVYIIQKWSWATSDLLPSILKQDPLPSNTSNSSILDSVLDVLIAL